MLGICCTFPEQLTFRVWHFHRQRVVFWHLGEICTQDQWGDALSPALGKSPQRRLCVGQALGLRSAWPSKTLPGQGP